MLCSRGHADACGTVASVRSEVHAAQEHWRLTTERADAAAAELDVVLHEEALAREAEQKAKRQLEEVSDARVEARYCITPA